MEGSVMRVEDQCGAVFLQWKNIDVCLDFECPKCGHYAHIDAWCCYQIQCDECGSVWRLPYCVDLRPGDPDEPFVLSG